MTLKEWANIINNNPISFGKEAGYTDLTALNNEWLKLFLFAQNDETLQAHRRSYKTTTLQIAVALMIVIYPEKTMILFRKTGDDVKEIMRGVQMLLQSDMFQALAFDLYGKYIKLETSSTSEIITNIKTSPSGTPQLLGIGSKGSITGKHADIIITDDIITLEDRISPAERNKTKLFYQELQNVKNKDGRFINTGTPWHKDDAFSLMPEPRKYDVYSTNIFSEQEIQDIRSGMTSSLFSANYELKHIADENVLFDNAKILTQEQFKESMMFEGISQLDAGYGGADGTAYTNIKVQPDGRIIVFGLLRQVHVDKMIYIIEAYRKHYRSGTLYNERNADKGYLMDKFSAPKQLYHENMNKYIKISTFITRYWNRIWFTPNTDKEYINQILDYNEYAEHDDAPDSLASALRVVHTQGKNVSANETIENVRKLGL